jgi:hypothetical protein
MMSTTPATTPEKSPAEITEAHALVNTTECALRARPCGSPDSHLAAPIGGSVWDRTSHSRGHCPGRRTCGRHSAQNASPDTRMASRTPAIANEVPVPRPTSCSHTAQVAANRAATTATVRLDLKSMRMSHPRPGPAAMQSPLSKRYPKATCRPFAVCRVQINCSA